MLICLKLLAPTREEEASCKGFKNEGIVSVQLTLLMLA